MTDVPSQETHQVGLPVHVHGGEVIATDIPAPIPLKSVDDISENTNVIHSPHHDETNVGVINDAAVGVMNDESVDVMNDATTQELLEQAASVAQEHMADDIVKADGDVDIVAAASEIVVGADHTVVIPTVATPDTGSILPSDLSAEVAASAAAVAASLNHEHNDLLLSSEIAQIAAESTSNATNAASHEQHLASRRQKDRERYASMTKDQREAYNKKRREQYHRQSEDSRRKRRERERSRYHSLSVDKAKERNARRAALERERYKRLSPAELAERNAKRRERAAILRAQKKAAQHGIDLHNIQHQAPDDSQLNVSAPDMGLVSVYDNSNLTGELNYDALVANTQETQSVIELPIENAPTNSEENDESVAV